MRFAGSDDGCTAEGQRVTCRSEVSLDVGETRAFRIRAVLDPDYRGDGSDVVNVATATSPTDPDGGDPSHRCRDRRRPGRRRTGAEPRADDRSGTRTTATDPVAAAPTAAAPATATAPGRVLTTGVRVLRQLTAAPLRPWEPSPTPAPKGVGARRRARRPGRRRRVRVLVARPTSCPPERAVRRPAAALNTAGTAPEAAPSRRTGVHVHRAAETPPVGRSPHRR